MPHTTQTIETGKTKESIFKFEINIPVILTMGLAIYLAFSSHQANLKNSEKINQLLVKYEKTLNSAIAGDPSTLKDYRKNLKRAVAGLSPQEKKILESVLALSSGNK
ncbi:hypothetical protein H4J56_18215 [Colwellia sp. BRX8-4]|uniref:hypothetical protein n=1 Tax=Colwellia sp. BRX8-4 TaxID=2759836 RepID=UPI0015F426CA|nr:hypothetical protein [Colwellia sp. BRX8-4]MBA6373354.1 hypothetical protein [Colwellia sp. BRX8-4]